MSEKCHCCGQVVRKLNPHRMDRMKLEMLQLLARAHFSGNPWVRVRETTITEKEAGVKKSPYRSQCHAMRLVWFGLAEHGERRSGMYRINANGLSFLRGHLSVPSVIYCKEGEVVMMSPERIFVGAVKGVVLDEGYWSTYASVQIPDFRAMAVA